MMKTILTLNPNKKTKPQNKTGRKAIQLQKGQNIMAGKLVKKEGNPKKKRKKRRQNPGFLGLTGGVLSPKAITGAGVGALQQFGGMMLTQFFSKKFAEGGGANDPNWTYKNYLFGLLGSFSGGVLAEFLRRGMGQEFLKGGFALILYKIFVNEIAPQNEFLMENFGQDDEYQYLPGDTAEDETGETWILGQDYFWRPASEAHRTIEGALKPPGVLGGTLVPPGPLGQENDISNRRANSRDPYAAVMTAGGSYPYYTA